MHDVVDVDLHKSKLFNEPSLYCPKLNVTCFSYPFEVLCTLQLIMMNVDNNWECG